MSCNPRRARALIGDVAWRLEYSPKRSRNEAAADLREVTKLLDCDRSLGGSPRRRRRRS